MTLLHNLSKLQQILKEAKDNVPPDNWRGTFPKSITRKAELFGAYYTVCYLLGGVSEDDFQKWLKTGN